MGAGKKLQAILKNKNVSIAKLSRDTGISSNTLYALIKRDSNLNTATMTKIAAAINISIDELSKLLSEEDSKNVYNEPKSRILDADIEETLLGTQEIIRKLNYLTCDYEERLYELNTLRKELEVTKKQKEELEYRIQSLEMRQVVLENDVENRRVELALIRSKF